MTAKQIGECNEKPVTSACEIKKGEAVVSPKKSEKNGVTLRVAKTSSE